VEDRSLREKTNDLIAQIKDGFNSSKEAFVESTDIVLKMNESNDIMKEIPIIKWVAKIDEFKSNYHKRRLHRNTSEFLRSVSLGDNLNIERLHDKITSDAAFEAEFQDIIADILLESSRPMKAFILGRLVFELASGSVQPDKFEMYSHIIHSSSVAALHALNSFMLRNNAESGKSGHGEIPEEGLLFSLGVARRFGNGFFVTQDGVDLWRHGFKGWGVS
jgi:hypothetical protein